MKYRNYALALVFFVALNIWAYTFAQAIKHPEPKFSDYPSCMSVLTEFLAKHNNDDKGWVLHGRGYPVYTWATTETSNPSDDWTTEWLYIAGDTKGTKFTDAQGQCAEDGSLFNIYKMDKKQ